MCCIPCGCISKGVSFLLPIVNYYLKELRNTIIKIKGVYICMLQMLHSTMQPVHNGSVVAYKLSLCMQSGSDACDIQ